MANTTWDIFHSDRLELQRSLTADEVRAGVARGEIGEDDLIRPSGSGAPWVRVGDAPPLPGPVPPADEPGAGPDAGPGGPAPVDLRSLIAGEHDVVGAGAPKDRSGDSDEDDEEGWPSAAASPYEVADHAVIPDPTPAASGGAYGELDLNLRGAGRGEGSSSVELVAPDWGDIDSDGESDEEEYDPLEEDEAVAEFTLTRGAPERVEELDLAAMVDVAFQLVLFFLVTATTVLYKTLEVPRPNPESSPTAAAAQGRSKTLDELKDDFILVEIDPAGQVKIDREPVPAERRVLVDRLRAERERTNRQSMLLSADVATPHRSAVLAYDVANEIGLGIAIARPTQTAGAAPDQPVPAPAPAGKAGGF